tara:strand:+ start:3092 stop:4282 length:1191 start_codon:yes stop_codon:yes gene_type:complete
MQVPPFSLSKQLAELGPELDSAVLRILRSGHYIGGQEVRAFEESFAKSIGVAHSVSCNSGTDALILALRALDIGHGDEVITSSFSFFATAEAISAVGAKPVFVDVDLRNFLIDINEIEKAINSATKAILPVHLFGCPVNMQQLMLLARKNNLKVIEDCAQASGASWAGRSVGSWGDVGCFSFFPTKNLSAAGDGGAVTTEDFELAKRMRELAVHGMPRRYLHTQLGYNSRLDAIQAAVLNLKLPKLDSWIQKRRSAAETYKQLLDGLPGLILPNLNKEEECHSYNQFVIRVVSSSSYETLPKNLYGQLEKISDGEFSGNNSRDSLKEELNNKGVNTIIYYPIPIHLQPAYKELDYPLGSLPITEKLSMEVLSLPMFPEISREDQEYVASSIRNLLS